MLFWGLDGSPYKYIVEFSKEEVEELLDKNRNITGTQRWIGESTYDLLEEAYEKHNKVDK